MRIRELIEVLQTKFEEHGDLIVLMPTDQEDTVEREVVCVTSSIDGRTGTYETIMLMDNWNSVGENE